MMYAMGAVIVTHEQIYRALDQVPISAKVALFFSFSTKTYDILALQRGACNKYLQHEMSILFSFWKIRTFFFQTAIC